MHPDAAPIVDTLNRTETAVGPHPAEFALRVIRRKGNEAPIIGFTSGTREVLEKVISKEFEAAVIDGYDAFTFALVRAV